MPITVSIVDDDSGIRSSIASLVRRAKSLELLGDYSDAESAIEEIPTRIPDVVLMDINMPGKNGVECVRQLKPMLPRTQFLMLTVYEDSDMLFNSFKAGACGYLLKRTAPARLIESIQEAHTGGSPITPQIARRLVQFFSSSSKTSEDTLVARLTANEREFLAHLSNGYTYKEIAESMKTSIDNVRSYVRAVYEKFQVHSRTEAVVKYLRAESGGKRFS